MKLHQIDIDGFGEFNGDLFGPFDKNIILFFGNNEAGKSTLMAFIQNTLFGYPRLAKDSYPPVNGGQHGGSIVIKDRSGHDYRITRHKSKNKGNPEITDSNLQKVDDVEEKLQSLTSGLTKTDFVNIFAFSLNELQNVTTLDDKSINEMMFNISLSVGVLADIDKTIEKEKDELWLPKGQKPMNKLNSDLKELDTVLKEATDNSSRYSDLKNKFDEKTKEINGLIADIEDNAKKGKVLSFMEDCWDEFTQLRIYEDKLGKMQFHDAITRPSILKEQLEKLQEREETSSLRLKEENENLEKKDDELKQKRKCHEPDILEYESEIESLNGKLQNQKTIPIGLQDANTKLVESEIQLEKSRKNLGIEYDDKTLASIDIESQPIHEEIEEFKLSVDKLEMTKKISEDKLSGFREEVDESLNLKNNYFKKFRIITWAPLSFLSSGFLIAGFISTPYSFYAAGLALLILVCIGLWDLWRLQNLKIDHKRAQDRYTTGQKRYGDDESSLNNKMKQWEIWLKENKLRTNLKPSGIEAFKEHLKSTRLHLDNGKYQQKRISDMEKATETFYQTLSPIAANQGEIIEKDANEAMTNMVTELYENLKRQNAFKIEIDRISSEVEDAKRKVSNIKSELNNIKDDIGLLVEQYKSDNRRDLYYKVESNISYTDVKSEIEQINENIKIRVRSHFAQSKKDMDTLLSLMDKTSQKDILSDLSANRKLHDELTASKNEFEEFRKNHFEFEITKIEEEQTESDLILSKNGKIEKLKILANQWLKYRMAEQILNKAKTKYQEENQPVVIKKAEQYFSDMTKNKYSKIQKQLGTEGIEITGSNVDRKEPSILSTGTRDQLYLALRFGYIKEYNNKKDESMPIIVDEVLVNFDSIREQNAAKIFVEFSKTNQIIIFTCRPEVKNLYKKIAPKQLKVIEI